MDKKIEALQWLAEMILSDCGCSTNNQRLLERVMARIDQYEHANTSPPASKPWVGLTEDERDKIILGRQARWEIAHMIEAKLREKNSA